MFEAYQKEYKLPKKYDRKTRHEKAYVKKEAIKLPTSNVMNHIPLHPFAIKSHPNLILSLPHIPLTFPPFPPFPDTPSLHCCITHHLSLRHPSPVTSSLHHSIVIILHYQFPSLPSFVISDLFHPY